MLTFEEAREALTEIADSLPEGIYDGLSGGIILLPDTKRHPEPGNGGLYILGEYHNRHMLPGRYISVYYGSFVRVHGSLSNEEQVERLREVLYHELTHHIEGLAGDRSLEKQDAEDIERYRRGQ